MEPIVTAVEVLRKHMVLYECMVTGMLQIDV